MRKAYQNAGLDFAGTDYVECHGTGTPVGDPIEVDAVGRCFSPREGPPLLIGSVSTPEFPDSLFLITTYEGKTLM
jgi:acyl transferase domain-containing protein